LIEDKIVPRNRDELEIMGYRDVLNTIHESHNFIPIKPSYILQSHRDLLKRTNLTYGGNFKSVQNYIIETKADSTQVTRFTPVAPYDTPEAVDLICKSYNRTISLQIIDPLILIPVFICDFLCIHPFNDGNGRMSRLLTLLMLYQSGYQIGKYISIEKQIEKTKYIYYNVLQNADIAWHEEKNDPTPYIKYMLQVILACYTEFEDKVRIMSSQSKGTTYDIVLAYVKEKVGKFTSADVLESCPTAGRTAALDALKKLTEEGIISRFGGGKTTFYVRNDNITQG